MTDWTKAAVRRRRGVAALAVAAGAALSVSSLAAIPAKGTISTSARQLTWTGPTWPVGAGAVAQIGTGAEPVCPPPTTDPAGTTCDHYSLTVDIPPSYWKAHPGGVRVSASWPDPNNKLEVAAYDATGTFVAWGLSGGRSTLVLSNPSGRYDIVVAPTLVVRPTSYVGTAKVISLPPTVAHPSLGGRSAYRAAPVPMGNPDKAPANTPAAYQGADLQLVAHPTGRLATEPTIGLDQHGTVFMNGKLQTDVPAYGTIHPPRVFVSDNHGRTWRDTGSPVVDAEHISSSDPYLAVDPDYGRVFWVDLQALGGSLVSYTDDGGRSWSSTVATPFALNDHPTILAAVPPPGFPALTLDPAFPKIVYYCVNQVANVGCARSLDGGRTFVRVGSPLLNQSTSCVVSTTDHLSADREGRIYLGSSGCNIAMVAMSPDGGLTWVNTAVTTKILAAYHDVATATDTRGNVYAAFTDDAHGLPYLSHSQDHGATWSTPVMVAPPDVHETGMLTLTAGEPGRVAIGMVATTVDNLGDLGRPWSYRMAVSLDALSASPLFVSNVATLPDLKTKLVSRGTCCSGMADFLDLQRAGSHGGSAWGTLSVPCTTKQCQLDRNGVNNLATGLGYAIEQVSGPALLGPALQLGTAPAVRDVVPTTAPLADTGTSRTGTLAAGLGLLVLLLAWRVRKAR